MGTNFCYAKQALSPSVNLERDQSIMNINPTYLEMSFERVGIRDSQKRLRELITEVAIEPIKDYSDELQHKFSLVEAILKKRIAHVIAYWCVNKNDPKTPNPQDSMSSITNASKNDSTLEDFYYSQVEGGMRELAPLFGLEMPENYSLSNDVEDLEYALLEADDLKQSQDSASAPAYENAQDAYADYYASESPSYSNSKNNGKTYENPPKKEAERAPQTAVKERDYADFNLDAVMSASQPEERPVVLDLDEKPELAVLAELVASEEAFQADEKASQKEDKAIVLSKQDIQSNTPEIHINTKLNLNAEQAWEMTYGLIGYASEYIQVQMLPRWQQNPEAFEKDRTFLYKSFMEIIRNAAGVQMIAGHFVFANRPMSVDQLWSFYFSDLAKNVGPQLTAARLHAAANDPWYVRLRKDLLARAKKTSPVWLLALSIALIFDALTTYVSLDQTPMEGFMVIVFTVLITALFQIADLLVISYRQREFEAEGFTAKFKAQFDRLSKTLEGLDTMSDSFVQLSMEKSRAHADWKAAEDNRQIARRGRYWSARIADINIIVTAYGFAYMFLNAEEPMYALFQQIEYIFVQQAWDKIDLWVFLMIGLAVTVSFVINTAQRTEILGWSMNRLRNEA